MSLRFFFFFLLLGYQLHAQQSIKGKVISAQNGQPLSGCSVFISGTTRGTTSSSAGEFSLSEIPGGSHELIVSSIGYETVVYSFTQQQLPLQLRVEMKEKVTELENVVLEPFVEEGWDRWGKTFTENFIGTTPNAAQCRILNTKQIRFRYYKRSNRLVAIADEPLRIENKALGYEVQYQLENFQISFKDGAVYFIGYPRFIPMRDDKVKKRWRENRDEAYYGSILHFMRSLYKNKLAEEKFEVRRMTRSVNVERERVRDIYRKAAQTGSFAKLPVDSVAYYDRVMRQREFIDTYEKPVLTGDSLLMNNGSSVATMHFENYIYVLYRGELEDPIYANKRGTGNKRQYQSSLVTLTGDQLIQVDASGTYYNPIDFFTSGYWAWAEKMADSLPFEYEPGEGER